MSHFSKVNSCIPVSYLVQAAQNLGWKYKQHERLVNVYDMESEVFQHVFSHGTTEVGVNVCNIDPNIQSVIGIHLDMFDDYPQILLQEAARLMAQEKVDALVKAQPTAKVTVKVH